MFYSITNLVCPAVLTYSIVLLGSLIGIYFFKGSDYLIKAFQLSTPLKTIGLGLVAGLGVVGLSVAAKSSFKFAQSLEDEMKRLIGKITPVGIFLVALFSGLGEEVLFRGLLQPYLGILLTSVIFGLLHFPIKQSLYPWTIFATVMGFILGGLYLYTGSLITPIIAHFTVNCINLFRLTYPDGETISSLPD